MRTMFYSSNAKTFQYAHKLRRQMTDAEKSLWKHLCRNQLDGYRFKRQHPIINYIADFYCHKAKLIIEVDGKIHEQNEQIIHDRERTTKIETLGCRVMRFTNTEVMNQIEYVIMSIRKELPTSKENIASPLGEVGGKNEK